MLRILRSQRVTNEEVFRTILAFERISKKEEKIELFIYLKQHSNKKRSQSSQNINKMEHIISDDVPQEA